jgi:hypothetical protein
MVQMLRLGGHYHLGDVWARLNHAIRGAEQGLWGKDFRYYVILRRRIKWFRGVLLPLINYPRSLTFGLYTYEEVLAELNVPHGGVQEDMRLQRKLDHEAYGCVYYPTFITHHDPIKQIAYSFDANYQADLKIPPNVNEILEQLRAALPDYKIVKVGLPMSVPDCVKTLAQSAAYLGIENGISHINRSVGTPMFMIQYRTTTLTEVGFPFSACSYTVVTPETAAEQVASFVRKR